MGFGKQHPLSMVDCILRLVCFSTPSTSSTKTSPECISTGSRFNLARSSPVVPLSVLLRLPARADEEREALRNNEDPAIEHAHHAELYASVQTLASMERISMRGFIERAVDAYEQEPRTRRVR
jgi:hypothetical protein